MTDTKHTYPQKLGDLADLPQAAKGNNEIDKPCNAPFLLQSCNPVDAGPRTAYRPGPIFGL